MQLTDARLKSQPEVARVLGKAGRADTSTDAAPLSMLETIVVLKPREQWPRKMSQQELIAKFDAAMKFPGVANAWTMPVRGRIDMLATGMRSPLGLKIAGPDLQKIQELGTRVEELLRDVRGTRSVFAERANDGRYIDIQWDRGELGRAGISMEEAQVAVQNAIGGDNVTTVIQGRARYPVNVRLPRDSRDNLDALRQVLVGGSGGDDPVPLGTTGYRADRAGTSDDPRRKRHADRLRVPGPGRARSKGLRQRSGTGAGAETEPARRDTRCCGAGSMKRSSASAGGCCR